MSRTESVRVVWIDSLSEDDLQFLKRFLLASGSLKALAEEYSVSYPTVRGRLDRLIAKVKAADDPADVDPFERALRVMMADGKLSATSGRELLDAHQHALNSRRKDP